MYLSLRRMVAWGSVGISKLQLIRLYVLNIIQYLVLRTCLCLCPEDSISANWIFHRLISRCLSVKIHVNISLSLHTKACFQSVTFQDYVFTLNFLEDHRTSVVRTLQCPLLFVQYPANWQRWQSSSEKLEGCTQLVGTIWIESSKGEVWVFRSSLEYLGHIIDSKGLHKWGVTIGWTGWRLNFLLLNPNL